MNDLISRQAAIDLWEQYHPYIATKACEYDAMLRQLPSAQPEPRWIPCSERLPEKEGQYLATCGRKPVEQVRMIDYIPDRGWYGEGRTVINAYVIAWMPIPSPYREEGEK